MRRLTACSLAPLLVVIGCGRPNAANIELRKQIQSLNAHIDHLELRHDADRATIDALQRQGNTVAQLPSDRLDRLFTSSGIKMLRLTRMVDVDRATPGFEAWAVSFSPVDQTGDELKASGHILVEVLDGSTVVETYTVDAPESKRYWSTNIVYDGYVIERPWSGAVPMNPLTARVTFTDELTGRRFVGERVMR
jgi:outer membrane murein-binding lipoprotein Lpp